MKKIIGFALAVVLVVSLAGCGASAQDESKEETSMFVKVENGLKWDVVYQKDTKVMYAVSDGSSNYGTFNLLVNPDGSPMLWGE